MTETSTEPVGPSDLHSFRTDWLKDLHDRQRQAPINFSEPGPSSRSFEEDRESHSANLPISSNSPLFLYAHAVYYERRGLLDDALVCYRKALRLDPSIDRTYPQLDLHVDALVRTFDQQKPKDKSAKYLSSSTPSIIHSDEEPDSTSGFDNNSKPTDCQSNNALPVQQKEDSHPSSTSKLLNELMRSFVHNPWQRPQSPNPGTDLFEINLFEQHKDSGHTGDIQHALCERHGEMEILNHVPNSLALSFEPLDPEMTCIIRSVPSELVVHIFNTPQFDRLTVHLQVNFIERFARVSRLARILTLEQSIWRLVCQITYLNDIYVNHPRDHPSYTTRVKHIEALCRQSHGNDWRRMYIEQPRVRIEGCYIALVRYPRLGESNSLWYTPTHFVTYFRYLRLFANGTCLTLTSTDEPNAVVRDLQQSPSHSSVLAGILHGRWLLEDNILRVYDLQACSQQSGRRDPSGAAIGNRFNYRVEMHCRIQSAKRGKMNKLDMLRLATLNLTTGEELEVPIPSRKSGSKPFVFSRVLAYDLNR